MAESVDRYLASGLDSVDGWLNPVSAQFITEISRFQKARGLTGSAGEIGVHHGKLFLLLHLTRDEGRPTFAVDLFEDQHLNTDESGKGDEGQFLANVSKWGGDKKSVEIFKGSSLELDPARVVERCGKARFVSVDGGHTEECTVNDLRIAEAVSEPHGVVVLDDVFNEFFPEVSMGLMAYIAEGRMRPFAMTTNKLYLADPQFAPMYREHFSKGWANRRDKTCVMFGSDVDLYGIRYASYPFWKQKLRDSPLYPQLKKLKSSLETA